jgi:hypothetical protein
MKILIKILLITWSLNAIATPESIPDRVRGEGPFERLILRGVIIINGEGAPPVGPMDVLVEGNRIMEIRSLGLFRPVPEDKRIPVQDGDRVLELDGHYLLPGFIDMHAHFGGDAQGVPAEYVAKLWLGHGITTIREPGSFNGLDWVVAHQARSEKNEIAAPRIFPYVGFGQGHEGPFLTEEDTRRWVRDIAKRGASGIKFFGAAPNIMRAALDEAAMEHWYGLPEAMFEDRVIQDYPLDYNYDNEQHRFGEAGRLWAQTAQPDSEKWRQVRDELISLNFTINPTLTIYEASRDLMREMNADWQKEYTPPSLWQFFQPSLVSHGSYWHDWTTSDEVAWKNNFKIWMQFLNDYKNHGGRITLGSDAGYIWKLYGFAYIREMELLQEAGFHPLEVVRSATFLGAQVLGMDDQIGSIRPGKLADLVITQENPIANFKVLYGTGHFKLGADNKPERVGGVKYTIKDGILFDAKELLSDVRKIVREAKTAE